MRLTDEQRRLVGVFLTSQGLTFRPLFEELVDHVSSDLEEKMASGITFDEAWRQTFNELSENHFRQIQKETMETINRRLNVSRSLSYVTLALITVSLVFKVLHLQGGGAVLLLSFATMIGSLLFSSLSGIYLNREKKGGARLLGVVAGIGFLAVAFGFKLLHLPGADQLVMIGVIVTIVSLIVNTVYVYRNASGSGNLLTFLHEKYTPGIERLFLLILVPVTLLRLLTMFSPGHEFAGGIVILIVILGGGLQLVALSWRAMEKDLSKRSAMTLTATIASGTLLALVFLGPILSVELRITMIIAYSFISAWLAYIMEADRKGIASLVVTLTVPVIFLGWGLIRLSILPASANSIFFNIPVMALMTVALILCRKNDTVRTFAIVSFASYLFEYPL